jgi:hypothetical protein
MTDLAAADPSRAVRPRDLLLLAAVILICFGGSLTVGFFLDDYHIVERARAAGWSPGDLSRAFTVFDPATIDTWCLDDQQATRFFRPLLVASFKLDHAIWGLTAAGYHLTNLALHLVNSWLVLALLLALGAPARQARLAAVLFAAFAHNGVAVVWIAGRTELLLATFLLSSTYCYARALISRRRGFALASLGLAACALLTKEGAVALPGYLFGVDWILGDAAQPWPRRIAAAARRLAPTLALVLGFLVFRLGWFGPLDPPPKPYYYSPTDPGFLAFLALKTVYYLFAWLTTFPVMPVAPLAFLADHLALLAVLVALTAGGWYLVVRALRREPRFWGLAAWLLACQVPVAMVMASSHYLYMGNAAMAAILAMLLARPGEPRMTRRRRAITGALLALFLAHGAYNVYGYHGLARFNDRMAAAVARLEGNRNPPATSDLYLVNLHLTGAHLGQELRLTGRVPGARAHLLTISSLPFDFGPPPRPSWPDPRTLVLDFDHGLVASDLIRMLVLMGADLTPGVRHRSGPAWVTPHGASAGAIDRLVIEFDRPPDGAAIQVLMLRAKDGRREVVSLTAGGEEIVPFGD